MAANVTVRGKFLDDARADVLGQLLGIDPDLARMKMIRLWSWMTEHHKGDAAGGVVDEVQLIGRFGPDGPAHLVRAKLAREVEPGQFYICGANGDEEGKSDLGWLARKRSAGHEGGTKRANQARAKQKPSTEQAEPKHERSTDEARGNPQDPGSGIRDPDSEERESRGPAAPAALALDLTGPEPPAPRPGEAFAAEAVAFLNDAAGRTFDPTTKATVKLCAALEKQGRTVEQAREVIRAKAAEWLGTSLAARVCPATLFAADNFDRYLDEIRAGPPKRAGPGLSRSRPPTGLAATAEILADHASAFLDPFKPRSHS